MAIIIEKQTALEYKSQPIQQESEQQNQIERLTACCEANVIVLGIETIRAHLERSRQKIHRRSQLFEILFQLS